MNTLRELIQYRDVLYMLVWREIKIRYKQSILGAMWALLMPLIIVGAGIAVRFAFATVSGGKVHAADIAAVAVKSAPYGFLVAGIRFGTQSLIANSNLVTKVYFPRLIFPFAAVLSQLFDFLIASAILGVVVLLVGTGVSIQLLWLPLLFVALMTLVVGAAVLLSAASLFFRDVKYLVEVLLTFAVFFVPVFYESKMMGKWQTLVLLNPISPILEAASATVVGHTGPNLPWVAYSLAFGSLFLCVSLVIFKKLEPYFAESV
jgi:lipopolysaccharide transport system permease protein